MEGFLHSSRNPQQNSSGIQHCSLTLVNGVSLMAVWFKALPLTASCLSPLSGFVPTWACEEVASDLGLGGVFRQVLRFTQLSTTR